MPCIWGIEEDQRKIHQVKWDVALNNHDNGGLNIGSFDSFNLVLLNKWKWRFLNNSQAIWVKVIQSIYGEGGRFLAVSRPSQVGGIQQKTFGSINQLHEGYCSGRVHGKGG